MSVLDLKAKTQAQVRFIHQDANCRGLWISSQPASEYRVSFSIDLMGVELFSYLNPFIKVETEAQRGLKAWLRSHSRLLLTRKDLLSFQDSAGIALRCVGMTKGLLPPNAVKTRTST